ncbi:MAG TPA: hypothetical protein VNE84_06250 [Candidatus Limnocylindria bacterium]|jgi:hypothetical protein|nr:hypothetical protein [Candidatus Limnocylindria bacterium]
MTSLAIEELPPLIKQDVEEFLENHPGSPAARLRPRIGMVGDIWLAFIGPKLRSGASGLGQTPRDALEDFNRHFMEPLISSNGAEPH